MDIGGLFSTHGLLHPIRSNQALERTADRGENSLSMTSILKPKAPLALFSGRCSLFLLHLILIHRALRQNGMINVVQCSDAKTIPNNKPPAISNRSIGRAQVDKPSNRRPKVQ